LKANSVIVYTEITFRPSKKYPSRDTVPLKEENENVIYLIYFLARIFGFYCPVHGCQTSKASSHIGIIPGAANSRPKIRPLAKKSVLVHKCCKPLLIIATSNSILQWAASNVKNKWTNVPILFWNETKTFWYRSRICLIENKSFIFGPKSALLDQIEMISFDKTNSGTNSNVSVSLRLDIGTFV